ncbi:MAG: dihydropteroate synthase [Chlamydiae bacterium]|nr:dihydropteroate synthase [Chlamydiota bacterium]MBI3278022.1 dihydropteroate synthase [Chlamydiota bacterium]
MRSNSERIPIESLNENSIWRIKGQVLPLLSRPLVMGILNVTPDSFYDGGRFIRFDQAIQHGLQLAKEGADFIDVGGLSTRPGSSPISEEEEKNRILPVIEYLSPRVHVPISVDTYRASVAQAALERGSKIVNDIGGLTLDLDMASVVSRFGAGLVLMHIRGTPLTMQDDTHYESLREEILKYFEERIGLAERAGIAREQILIDPGIGFGKKTEQNLEILKNLYYFRKSGRPLFIGPSRKSFIGHVLNQKPDERKIGSLACVAAAFYHGASVIRVHDVKETVELLKMLEAIEQQ